ncbi:MAG: hypothetical protein WA681_15660, partial [Candidatus Acidiferrales bacterium]
MNSFHWNLRYPDATEVKGFEPPVAAGGLDDTVDGPTVVPGTYSVVLDFGGQQTKADFTAALDPRLGASSDDLAARLALQLKIHTALDALNKDINRAIAVREKLVSNGHASAAADLDREIGNLVQLDIKSSEGSLLHETKLRSYLAYLAADIDLAYARPTAAQHAVFEQLDQEAKAGEQKLDAAIEAANKLP